MKKTAIVFLFGILLCSNAFSQKIGEWTTHFSYEKDLSCIVQGGEIVYAISDGKLFGYNPSDESIDVFARIGEDSVICMAYSEKNNCLIVARDNKDIDLFYPGGRTSVLSDIINGPSGLDKNINDIFIDDDYAYISTNFGLVILNIPREEIKASVLFRYPVYSSVIYNDKLYAMTSNGTLRINKSANIQSPDGWESVNFSPQYTGATTFGDDEIRKAVVFDNRIVFMIPSKALYSYDGAIVSDIPQVGNPQKILAARNRLIAFNTGNFWDFTTLADYRTAAIADNALQYIFPDKTNTNEYWIALTGQQLSSVKLESGTELVLIKSAIRPNGPASNIHFGMIYEYGKLLSVGGGASNKPYRYLAQLSEYKDNIWFQYSKKEIDDKSGKDSRDFMAAAIDPNDHEHIFVTSYGGTSANAWARNGGIYEFKNRRFEQFYNDENTPAIMPVTSTPCVLMHGMAFDKTGNLWIQNPNVTTNSIVVRKSSGEWTSLYYQDIKNISTEPRSFIIDKYNNKWSGTRGGSSYIFIFNEGSAALENTVAHRVKFLPRTELYDQDGQRIDNVTQFLCLAEDLNGNIWVGTNGGLFLIYNSADIFDRDIILNKIKVPKNDGTNEADILLENATVQDIKVDGANRKWIATTSGLYVISANGLETYHYFTTSNSPLPSDNILSLAIDQAVGRVFIGTDKGLVSYMGEATQGAKDYSNVYAYPNPVRPDYEGPVTITGLKENSTVKITDVKGNLITQGTSLGGQYIWNGKNNAKEKVATGVYLVFGSSEDGLEGIVSKIMVVSN
ncbi:MAG: hypothetical protein LBR34_01835 [Prevotella sp.]|jgi:hypothetical protein|nr:hypothetical protein [Prevotella sp.]